MYFEVCMYQVRLFPVTGAVFQVSPVDHFFTRLSFPVPDSGADSRVALNTAEQVP